MGYRNAFDLNNYVMDEQRKGKIQIFDQLLFGRYDPNNSVMDEQRKGGIQSSNNEAHHGDPGSLLPSYFFTFLPALFILAPFSFYLFFCSLLPNINKVQSPCSFLKLSHSPCSLITPR